MDDYCCSGSCFSSILSLALRMIHRTYIILACMSLGLLFSCVNREKSEEDNNTQAIQQPEDERPIQTITEPIWAYDSAADTLQYVGQSDSLDLPLGQLIDIVNKRFAHNQVVLDSLDRRNDTVFVKIDSAQYLTSQMGSAGAREYMAITTFTLTEAAGVNYVHYQFEEGDHAAPGVYDRLYFQKK